jgi:hypothetical protein
MGGPGDLVIHPRQPRFGPCKWLRLAQHRTVGGWQAALVTIGLVLDCRDPEVLADFWAPALGYERIGTAGQLP